jgi:hypothetical protein
MLSRRVGSTPRFERRSDDDKMVLGHRHFGDEYIALGREKEFGRRHGGVLPVGRPTPDILTPAHHQICGRTVLKRPMTSAYGMPPRVNLSPSFGTRWEWFGVRSALTANPYS